MKKRFSKKRVYRKRKSYTKKRRYSSPKPDGAITTKIMAQSDIQFETALGAGICFVNWCGNGVPAGTQAIRVTVAAEFTRWAAIY